MLKLIIKSKKDSGSSPLEKVQKFNLNFMPQLIPFYFLNQLSFGLLTLIFLTYFLSKYVLPLFTYRNVVRVYLTKLTK